MSEGGYAFHNKGIGSVLKTSLLAVPPNQRSYAWKRGHVTDLLSDLKTAISSKDDTYFLGTTVLVEDEVRLQIADGQQRLATTSIIFARCRDLLRKIGEDRDADSINQDFLSRYDRNTKDQEFLLHLNIEDNEFFHEHIIEKDWEIGAPDIKKFAFPSNRRLFESSQEIQTFLRGEIGHLNTELAHEQLDKWTKYLEKFSTVVTVQVPDEVGAFRMFETLNDRGLRASQADILKNYLFSRANSSSLDQMHGHWNQMYGTLSDTFDDADEQMVRYIRYYWTLLHGLTRDRELAKDLKDEIKSSRAALKFVSAANAASVDFAAIFQPDHSKWKPYGAHCTEDLRVLTEIFNIEQIVPLVFAVSHRFSVAETKKAFKLFVSWSARFLLGGSGRAGRLDKQYAEMAHDIGTGKIKTAKALRDFLADKVPTDDQFRRLVLNAKVAKPVLARYYLIALEMGYGDKSGELVPSRDVHQANLEHVIPKTFNKAFNLARPEYEDLINRLGNLAIINSAWNTEIGNQDFDTKKPKYAKSELELTSLLAKYKKFDRKEVDKRQKVMAELAPKVWSLKF